MTQSLTVRLYITGVDGKLEPYREGPLDDYGTCPNVGDLICHSWRREQQAFFSVQRRYFFDNSDGHPGWAIILMPLELASPVDAVVTAWYADDDEWAEHEEQERQEEKLEEERQRQKFHDIISSRKGPIEPPLKYYEALVLAWMASRRLGASLRAKVIPNFGENTRRSLLGRGFVEIRTAGKTPQLDEIALTSLGRKMWKKHKEFAQKLQASA